MRFDIRYIHLGLFLFCSLSPSTNEALGTEADTIPVADLKRERPVEFEREILPILKHSCISCHSRSDSKGDLVLENPESIREGGKRGPAVIPGKSDESLLLLTTRHAKKPFMPPKQNKLNVGPLSSEQLGLLKLWIDQGAKAEGKSTQKVEWYPLHERLHPIYALSLTPDGRLAACGRGNRLYVHNLLTGQVVGRPGDPARGGTADPDGVFSLAFDPRGQILASGGFRSVKLWRRPKAERGTALTDLGAEVTSAAASPDGARLALGLADGRALLWVASQGGALKSFPAHVAPVRGLQFSADGARVYSGSQDGTIAAWSSTDGLPALRIGAQAAVHAILLAGKDTQLAAACADGAVRVWTLPSPGNVPSAPMVLAGHTKPVLALAAWPGVDNQIVSGGEDGMVRFWDLTSGKEVRQVSHGGPVSAIGVRPDGKTLASGGADRRTMIWNAVDLKPILEIKGDSRARDIAELRAREEEYRGAIAKKIETELATVTKEIVDRQKAIAEAKAALDKLIQTDVAEQAALKTDSSEANKATAEAAAVARMKAEAALRTTENELKHSLTLESIVKVRLEGARKDLEPVKTAHEASKKALLDSESPVCSLAFSEDGLELATASEDGLLRIWREKDGASIDEFQGHSGRVSAIVYVKGRGWASVGADKTVALWNKSTDWPLAGSMGSPDDPSVLIDRVMALEFSPDGALLATGSGEPSRSGEIKVWKVADGSLVMSNSKALSDGVLGLAFSPDGRRIATGSADRTVRIFDASDGRVLASLDGHTNHVLGVTWSSNGEVLASAGADNSVKLWNVTLGEQISTMSAFEKEVTSVHFLPFSQELVTSCADLKVRIHNTADGKVRILEGATDYIYSSAIANNGRHVIAGGFSGVVHLWDFATGEVRGAFASP